VRRSFELQLDPHLNRWQTRSVHKAITNLVLNAMDAMAQGGMLTLRLEMRRHVLIELRILFGLDADQCNDIYSYYTTSSMAPAWLPLQSV